MLKIIQTNKQKIIIGVENHERFFILNDEKYFFTRNSAIFIAEHPTSFMYISTCKIYIDLNGNIVYDKHNYRRVRNDIDLSKFFIDNQKNRDLLRDAIKFIKEGKIQFIS